MQNIYRLLLFVTLVNELLCKVLCHNIYVVIQSIYELGIKPMFWAKTDNVQKILTK
jgi:hypothetical protein